MLKSVRGTCTCSSLFGIITLTLGILGGALSAQAATVFDTSAYDLEMTQGAIFGPDVAGGTFTAAESYLNSFTLYLGAVGGDPGNDLRAVVMAVDGSGIPTGSPLWTSDSFNAPGALAEFLFTPDMSVLTGTQYFIGVDSGAVSGAGGGDFTIGVTSGDPLAGGHVMLNSDGAASWTQLTFADVASVITMSDGIVQNPEPSTVLLVGMGLTILGARSRRRSV